jgi:transcriptional regulator with XRE-family HTH domain
MKQRDIIALVKNGKLTNERELATALSADRTLRILVKSDPSKKELRSRLRDMIVAYEKIHWTNSEKITDGQVKESDEAEEFAEQERKFISQRKKVILSRLEKLNLNQSDLGKLLDHHKSYVSELLNGIRPFSQKDLVLVHLLLKVSMEELIPVLVSAETEKRIREQVRSLENIKLKKSLELVAA